MKTAYVIGDNEISKIGLEASLKTATRLHAHGIDARIVTLSLTEKQREARKTISERWGITDHMDKVAVGKKRDAIPKEERAEFDRLCSLSKCDLNSFFMDGGTKEDLQALLDTAPTPLEFAISRINPDVEDVAPQLEPILREAAQYAPLDQGQIAKQIKQKIGAIYSLHDIKEQIKQFRGEAQRKNRAARRRDAVRITADPGTLKNLIQTTIAKAVGERLPPDWAKISRSAYQWFIENGAVARVTRDRAPLFLYDRLIFRPLGNRTERGGFNALLFRLTDLLQTSGDGRQLAEGLTHEILNNGTVLADRPSWMYTDHVTCTVYFNLNNDGNEIAKISPQGVEILQNGCNRENILLQSSVTLQPITYTPEGDCESSLGELMRVINHMTCSDLDKGNLFLWFMTILLIDFTSTRPIMRLEGPTGSGKSTAADLFTSLVLGEASHMKLTIAARVGTVCSCSVLCLDNIESAASKPRTCKPSCS